MLQEPDSTLPTELADSVLRFSYVLQFLKDLLGDANEPTEDRLNDLVIAFRQNVDEKEREAFTQTLLFAGPPNKYLAWNEATCNRFLQEASSVSPNAVRFLSGKKEELEALGVARLRKQTASIPPTPPKTKPDSNSKRFFDNKPFRSPQFWEGVGVTEAGSQELTLEDVADALPEDRSPKV